MTKLFLSTYYSLLFSMVYLNAYSLFNSDLPNPKFIWLGKALVFFPTTHWTGLLIFLITALLTLLCIFIRKKYLRIITSLFMVLLFSLKYSFYGKIDHVYHMWIISSLLIPFVDPEELLHRGKNLLILKISQIILLTHYLSAGLWKLREFEEIPTFSSLYNTALDHIAYGLAERSGDLSFVIKFFINESPFFITAGFVSVICFQLATVIPILCQRYFILFGVLAVAFHLITGFSLGIWYFETVISSLFFLICSEVFLNHSVQLAKN